METYGSIEFHASCSHFFKEGIRHLVASGYTSNKQKINNYLVVELHLSTLKDLIIESDLGLFSKTDYTQIVIISSEKLMPLANYYVVRNNYRITAIRSTSLSEIQDFFTGNKVEMSGDKLTESEFRAFKLSLSGTRNKDGINPKTFCSQRYSAIKKLGKDRYSLLYT
ncbi:hypothetical protein ACLHDD_19495 [Pantoea sp. NSTU24]|uniref:hypothetical protein n=1 Tax=Pantoea sp. NSTU24 TaxID=3391144 RepID=UPI003D03D947